MKINSKGGVFFDDAIVLFYLKFRLTENTSVFSDDFRTHEWVQRGNDRHKQKSFLISKAMLR